MNIIETDEKYLAKTYKRFPVALDHGKGSLVYDAEGREYIDFGTGIAVSSFGISDDVWLEAVTKQAGALSHTSNLYYHEPCARLAEMLAGRTGMKRVFFSNSGAEANECAIKAARKYSEDKYGPGRY
ncbi:MAG: aminotransferase class III-fold pyridoxal phosphate-dependent enzyme, partial [Clostridia bacterium]|nr:aminotransferase class III-fold pyridoxal phosphate-dependent enzyme [Clostridia bacterium]